jgi:hypothetical protein
MIFDVNILLLGDQVDRVTQVKVLFPDFTHVINMPFLQSILYLTAQCIHAWIRQAYGRCLLLDIVHLAAKIYPTLKVVFSLSSYKVMNASQPHSHSKISHRQLYDFV